MSYHNHLSPYDADPDYTEPPQEIIDAAEDDAIDAIFDALHGHQIPKQPEQRKAFDQALRNLVRMLDLSQEADDLWFEAAKSREESYLESRAEARAERQQEDNDRRNEGNNV